jgi:transposase
MEASQGGGSHVRQTNSAGVDWAKEEHALCVIDEAGRKVLEGRFVHDEQGIARLCTELASRGLLRVAIERPEGLLVERLLEAGLVVLAVHPNQLKAARPRFRASGSRAKSDSFDAFCLSELARTDHHRFRALVPDSDETKALRVLTRARDELVGTRVALANRLRSQLEAFWPGSAVVFKEIDSSISLAFLERYPSPKDAQRLGEKRLFGASSVATATPGAREPLNSSSGCARLLAQGRERLRWRPAVGRYWRW